MPHASSGTWGKPGYGQISSGEEFYVLLNGEGLESINFVEGVEPQTSLTEAESQDRNSGELERRFDNSARMTLEPYYAVDYTLPQEEITSQDHVVIVDISHDSNVGFSQDVYSLDDVEPGSETEVRLENSPQGVHKRAYFVVYDHQNPGNRVNDLRQIDSTYHNNDIVFADDNIINAGLGRDIVFGQQGNDNIRGGEGNDFLVGGEGNDSLYGDNGSDYLDGGIGNDALIGGEGYDSLYGSEGDDDLQGLRGNDSILGEAGNDTLEGGNDNDTLDGGVGNDYLYGGHGDDSHDGGSGDDRIFGGIGNDTLTGNSGNDFLSGGVVSDGLSGSDITSGGSGADIFTLQSNSFMHYLGSGFATITDFSRAEGDIIWLGDYGDDNDNFYSLGTGNWGGTAAQDTAIYYQGDLIARVYDTAIDLNLDIDYIRYFGG
ncbi:MAG: calcium-binding protein [Cyanobacteria bacterium P01_H01_bin.150]